jgi:hypothetical protein
VNGADVRMIQCRGSFGLALEAAERLGIVGYIFGQELKRNEAIKFDVLGFVHYTHSAAAQFFDDAVVRDGLADQDWRINEPAPFAIILGAGSGASQSAGTSEQRQLNTHRLLISRPRFAPHGSQGFLRFADLVSRQACTAVQNRAHFASCAITHVRVTISLFSLASFPRRPSAPQAVPGGATDSDNGKTETDASFIFWT